MCPASLSQGRYLALQFDVSTAFSDLAGSNTVVLKLLVAVISAKFAQLHVRTAYRGTQVRPACESVHDLSS